jgi:hypothetical protein
MITLTRKFIKYSIILFLLGLQSHICLTQQGQKLVSPEDSLALSCKSLRLRVQDICYRIKSSNSEKEDEKLSQELSSAVADFYKKIVEISALYLSGYSDALYKKLLFEITRDLLVIGKLLLIYIPKMIKDPKVPWKVKMKKCVYATGVMTVTALWIKEIYKYKTKDDILAKPILFGKRSGSSVDDINSFFGDNCTDLNSSSKQ